MKNIKTILLYAISATVCILSIAMVVSLSSVTHAESPNRDVPLSGSPFSAPLDTLYIGEGDSGTLKVYLKSSPIANVTSRVTITSGGSHASIDSGSVHTFSMHSYNSANAQVVSIIGTEDTATNELDSVTVSISLTSADSLYQDKTYAVSVKIVDNDTPIVVSLASSAPIKTDVDSVQYCKIYFTLNRRTPVAVTSDKFKLHFTDLVGDLVAAHEYHGASLPDDYDFAWYVSSLEVGSNDGFLFIDVKDDDVVEQDAMATAVLSLDSALGTVDSDHNTLTFVHSDDSDRVTFDVRFRSGDYYLDMTRTRSFPMQMEFKAKSGPNPASIQIAQDDEEVALPNPSTLESITIRVDDSLYFTRKWYTVAIEPGVYQTPIDFPSFTVVSPRSTAPAHDSYQCSGASKKNNGQSSDDSRDTTEPTSGWGTGAIRPGYITCLVAGRGACGSINSYARGAIGLTL